MINYGQEAYEGINIGTLASCLNLNEGDSGI